MKFRACIIGHFGKKKNMLSGQTIKTRIVSDEIEKQVGKDKIIKIDTEGGIKKLLLIWLNCFYYFLQSRNVIMFPAQNGVLVITPILWFCNIFFRRRLHYVVIGGWLPEFLRKHKLTSKMLKHFHGIYVETVIMKTALEKDGFNNIIVMPNCKPLHILKESELQAVYKPPYKLCTFSRVLKEKGIEDAIEAVRQINEADAYNTCSLDIYGQIDEQYEEQFKKIMDNCPEYIKYRGTVDYNETTDVLKQYYALLFPTYYEGEGFAGTIIDGFAAGLPIIATDWRYNSEIIDHLQTGVIYPSEEAKSLIEAIRLLINADNIIKIKQCSLIKSNEFLPENVVSIIMKELW